MAIYDRQIASAKRMIGKYGQLVTWRQVRDAAPTDESQPWKPNAQESEDVVEYPVNIVFFTTERYFKESTFYVQGTEVPTGDLNAYMGATEFTPRLKDVIIRDGVELRIESIDTTAPNGRPILHKMVLKS